MHYGFAHAGTANEALHAHSTQLSERLVTADSELSALRSECMQLRQAAAASASTQAQVEICLPNLYLLLLYPQQLVPVVKKSEIFSQIFPFLRTSRKYLGPFQCMLLSRSLNHMLPRAIDFLHDFC